MFDHGTFYRSLGCDLLDYYDQDTFRSFIDKEHRDWDASRLRAHHFDVEKLFKWAVHGPDGKARDDEGDDEGTDEKMAAVVNDTDRATNETATNETATNGEVYDNEWEIDRSPDKRLYAAFVSTQGKTATFPMNNEGNLRVFLQRVLERCADHTNCRIEFFNDSEVAMAFSEGHDRDVPHIAYIMNRQAELDPTLLEIN